MRRRSLYCCLTAQLAAALPLIRPRLTTSHAAESRNARVRARRRMQNGFK